MNYLVIWGEDVATEVIGPIVSAEHRAKAVSAWIGMQRRTRGRVPTHCDTTIEASGMIDALIKSAKVAKAGHYAGGR